MPLTMTWPDTVTYSPVILVGTITKPPAYVGSRHQSRWLPVPTPPDSSVQLFRVIVEVETVLQSYGESPKREVPIYYFLWNTDQSYSGPPRLGNWQVGDRVMFFLRCENGYLRTVEDQRSGGTTIRVFSGAHPGFREDIPAHGVIDLLLTRGEGAGDEQMIQAIDGFHVSEVDPEYSVQKLRKLIGEETPPIATAACQKLKSILDMCFPPPYNAGPWQAPCNDRSKMNLPCPGPCCGYGENPGPTPGAKK